MAGKKAYTSGVHDVMWWVTRQEDRQVASKRHRSIKEKSHSKANLNGGNEGIKAAWKLSTDVNIRQALVGLF